MDEMKVSRGAFYKKYKKEEGYAITW